MFPTVEVRWFSRGRVPPDVTAWFHQGQGPIEQEPPREDVYLRPVEGDGLGIKLREGQLEVKQRFDQQGAVSFHQRVTGRVEHWRKWSFELAAAGSALPRAGVHTPPWIAVQKERQLRRYEVVDDGGVRALSAPNPPNRGCELELTRVDIAGQPWWTLAFEAFGAPTTLRANLLLVARYVFSDHEPPSLRADDSRGYPAWLNTLNP